MTVYLNFASHMSYQATRLYHESSTFDHSDPANIFQLEIETQPNPGFVRPKTAVLQICVLHIPFQSVDKDSHPIYECKDH
jgi:hypothetical protein